MLLLLLLSMLLLLLLSMLLLLLSMLQLHGTPSFSGWRPTSTPHWDCTQLYCQLHQLCKPTCAASAVNRCCCKRLRLADSPTGCHIHSALPMK
jgi:hypothetical protein